MQLCSASADLSWHFTWWSVVTQAHVLHALALAALAFLVPSFPLAGCSRKLSIATISANFYPFHCLIFLFLLSGLSACAMCRKYKRHWAALCYVGWWGPHVPFHLSSNSYNIIACFNKYSFNEIWAIQYINNEKYFFFRLKMKKIQWRMTRLHGLNLINELVNENNWHRLWLC